MCPLVSGDEVANIYLEMRFVPFHERAFLSLDLCSRQFYLCRNPSYVSTYLVLAQMGDSNDLTFAVIKSSGETKPLEVIADEQEASSKQKIEARYDPTLVYAAIAVGSVFGVLGIGVCVVVVIISMKKDRACKTHAAPEDKQVIGNDVRLFHQRTKPQVRIAFQEE